MATGFRTAGFYQAAGGARFFEAPYTDDLDRRLGIWNDIFLDTVNIHSQISDRNKYGPVLFEMSVEMLRNLPAPSRVLVTRSNPSKWQVGASEADCYFLSKSELGKGFGVGNFDHMLVIRTPNGLIPFANFLQRHARICFQHRKAFLVDVL